MKYLVDNDLHIHSQLSACSQHPEQTNERIFHYAQENSLKTICLANHFWDEKVQGAHPWYAPQDFAHISKALPLPSKDGIRFLFGCETELDKNLTLGISKERMELLDFIVIPVTHFQIEGFTLTDEEASSTRGKISAWIRRFGAVLGMDLPFYKVGFAHLTCRLISNDKAQYLDVLSGIPEQTLRELFTKAADLGAGIELNANDMNFEDADAEIVLRPYRIAKQCGCKFYCGSDAHTPDVLDIAKKILVRAVELLELEESDKFII